MLLYDVNMVKGCISLIENNIVVFLQGSAEVIYTKRSDAFAALKRYNNVLLDGKPMKIEIVGSNSGMPISARVNVTGVNGRRRRTVLMTYVIFHFWTDF